MEQAAINMYNYTIEQKYFKRFLCQIYLDTRGNVSLQLVCNTLGTMQTWRILNVYMYIHLAKLSAHL